MYLFEENIVSFHLALLVFCRTHFEYVARFELAISRINDSSMQRMVQKIGYIVRQSSLFSWIVTFLPVP